MVFGDFFAGIGGFRLGLEAVGYKCAYSAEWNESAQQTYSQNFGSGFDASDISKLKSIPQLDLITAGFPCQPYSIAGKRNGLSDKRSQPFFKLMDLVRARKTPVLLLENVPNLVSIQNGSAFREILKTIEDSGYQAHCDILDAADFGVPQKRKRLFIVAFHSDLGDIKFEFPDPKHNSVPVKSILESGDYSIPISEKWQTYIDLYQGKVTLEQIGFDVPKTRKALERADPDADLENCIFQMRSSGIRALSVEKALPTFAVSISGGGAMIPVYSKERRHLSLLEMQRIMGFPDSWTFPVARTHAIKQLANSVCPPVVSAIGKAINTSLKSHSVYSTSRADILSSMSSPVGLTTFEVSG